MTHPSRIPYLPARIEHLADLAENLWWSWQLDARALFRTIDEPLWHLVKHNPIALLRRVDPSRLANFASDPTFLARYDRVLERYRRALESNDTWFHNNYPSVDRPVAYFCAEFGLHNSVPIYSGGLGILAGDHCKAASDLGVPLVGVGLFYRSGYFSQQLTVDGMQQERFSELDPDALALTRCDGIRISVDLAGEPLQAQVWQADVGRVQLYLLDSDVDGNTPEGRAVTDRLYGGDTEHRIRQEILLGIGGVRALQALGLDPQVFHTNEGHAGFLGLERIRRHMDVDGLTFPEALEAVRAGANR